MDDKYAPMLMDLMMRVRDNQLELEHETKRLAASGDKSENTKKKITSMKEALNMNIELLNHILNLHGDREYYLKCMFPVNS